jgi:spore coat protein U-like protein
MTSLIRSILAVGIAIGSVDVAAAATATTTLGVEVTIAQTCTITANPKLTFNTFGGLATNNDATTNIQVNCSTGTPYTIGLSAGSGAGATVTARRMTGAGGATINYALFRDAGRTQNWGNTAGTDTASGTGSGAAQNIAVFGRIPVQTTPAAGTYTDTVTISLNY